MKDPQEYLNFIDILYIIIFFIVIYFFSNASQSSHKENQPIYLYLKRGIILKIAGAISFCLIYILYYEGGDTMSYFEGGQALVKLMQYQMKPFLSIMSGKLNEENWSYFNTYTGWPPVYMYAEPGNFIICRLMVPILFFSFNSILLGTMILSGIAFIGIWKFLTMLAEMYPGIERQLAISVIFMPSLLFWGSGIMKDTFALAATLWLVYNIYKILIKREKIITNLLLLIMNVVLLISVKPYIFLALLPSAVLWLSLARIRKIKNNFLRYIAAPVVLFAGIVLGYFIMTLVGENLGEYSTLDKILSKATVTQQDLIREEAYGENYFNIGTFDPNFGSIIQKAPQAIIAGLFRPFIWNAKNLVMVISGLESFFIMLLFFYVILRVGLFNIFQILKDHPFLIFSIVFSLIFAFSVGLTSANYGALVRYKIHAIPFFVSSMFIIRHLHNEMRKEKLNETSHEFTN